MNTRTRFKKEARSNSEMASYNTIQFCVLYEVIVQETLVVGNIAYLFVVNQEHFQDKRTPDQVHSGYNNIRKVHFWWNSRHSNTSHPAYPFHL